MSVRVGVGVGQTEPARLRVGDAGAPLDLLDQIGRRRRLRKSTTQPLALKRLCNQAKGALGVGSNRVATQCGRARRRRTHAASFRD